MATKHNLITQWLEKHRTTAEHLARLSDIHYSTLYRFINGNTDDMRLSTARAISRGTGYELDVCDIMGIPPRVVYVNVQESENGGSTYMVDAPAFKDCISHTPSFGITVGNTSLSRIPNTAQSCPPKSDKTCLDRIFDFWVRVFAKSRTRTKLTLKRKKAIQTALDDFSVEQLIDSIQGHANDPWRQSRPVRHELSTLLRPGNIERGLDAKDEFASPDQEEDDTFWEDQIASEGGGA